mmetsp:Transcript_167139/g.536828  ORF Transcript_167139/g.536828 Transcript_167139/m.536828 type:complete len:131 (-) Transcript_167139:225-617(-)
MVLLHRVHVLVRHRCDVVVGWRRAPPQVSSCERKKITHAALTVGAAALLGFNLLHEIPHFLFFRKEDDSAAVAPPPYSHIWTCAGDAESPLWLKRLPFFVAYFVGCSWCSVALAYRFARAASRCESRCAD